MRELKIKFLLSIFAPLCVAIDHPLPFVLTVLSAAGLSWVYSDRVLGRISWRLAVSMTVVGIWLGSIGILMTCGFPIVRD